MRKLTIIPGLLFGWIFAVVNLNRNYNIPVFNSGQTSRFIRHDISA